MDDEIDLTPEEAEALFRATQPIGNAIRVVAEAELIVADVDTASLDVRARLDDILRRALDADADPDWKTP